MGYTVCVVGQGRLERVHRGPTEVPQKSTEVPQKSTEPGATRAVSRQLYPHYNQLEALFHLYIT